MSGHNHDHGHGGHCHAEGHDHSNDITPAIQSLLYSQIQFDSITTLNGTATSYELILHYLYVLFLPRGHC